MTRRKEPVTDARVDPVAAPAERDAAAPVLGSAPEPPQPEPPQPELPQPAPPQPRPAQPAPPAARRGGLLAPLLGGALAAIAGFALAQFDLLGLQPPDPAPQPAPEIVALSDRQAELQAAAGEGAAALARLTEATEALAARIAALENAPPPDLTRLDDLDRRLAAIETMPATGAASGAALAARLRALEQAIAEHPARDAAEIDAALARLAAFEAEAAARTARATAAAERAAALAALRAAAAGGAGFQAELAALGDPDLAGTLAPHVAGVATLATLRADFPDAARAALAVARQPGADEGWLARLTDFLADQTAARPVTPLAGDTPEAVLSRAEFALGEGRIADALAELAALDGTVRAPLDPWITAATARLAVDAALAEAP